MGADSSVTAQKEGRRLRAFELKEEGWDQCDIAEALGVTEGAVSQWMTMAQERGPGALVARPHSGAPARLSDRQWQRLLAILAEGAVAYGFRGEVWTCDRVARVIAREFGVSYHRAHVSRLLMSLDWTPQIPRQRASQRNEEEIRRWRTERWPRLKRGP
jgi:transposase